MKKWRIVLSAIILGIAAVACGTAIGCKKPQGTSDAGDWSTNSRAHWHESANGEQTGYAEHTYNSNYHCTTCGYDLEIAGITVTKRTYEYSLQTLTRNIPVNDITVKAIAADNLYEATLNSDQYELEYYKGDTKLDNLNGVAGGTYNIWATANISGETYDSFVVVYLKDPVKNFDRFGTFNRQQSLGLDEISDTWRFKVTYTSGKESTVGLDDEHIKISNFSTYIEAENKTATITYSETDCDGTVVEKSQDVTYTIIKNENSNVSYYEYSYDELQEELKKGLAAGQSPADKLALKPENFASAGNSFLTLLEGGDSQYRNSGSNKCIEIKGDTLTVTFEGAGILVIGARSTSESDYSSIAVRDAEGNYIAATYTTPASKPTIYKDEDDNRYAVTGGSGANVLTFTISEAGTYTICTLDEINYDGDLIETNRYTRIEKIEMTDIRTDSEAEVVG